MHPLFDGNYHVWLYGQAIDSKGYQKELPDIWLTEGNPWEMKRHDIKYEVSFGGKTEKKKNGDKEVTVWTPSEKVRCSMA